MPYQIDFATATKGHTLRGLVTNPKADHAAGYKKAKVECTCGWSTERPKVPKNVEVNGKTVVKNVDMPMEEFRGLGDKHLYGLWKDAQQGRLV